MLKICLVFWESEPQYAYKLYAYKKKHVGDLKALRASWVVKLHDFLMIEQAHEIIKNGLKASAICQRQIPTRK